MIELDLLALTSAAGLTANPTEVEAALVEALNTVLAGATQALAGSLPANATVNVVALLASLGIVLPPQFVSLGGLNLAAVPVAQLQVWCLFSPLLFLLLTSLRFQGPVLQQLLDPLVMAFIASQVDGLLRPSVALTVLDGVGPDGKWPGSLGNVVVLEAAAVPDIVKAALPANTALLVSLLNILGAGAQGLNTLGAGQQLGTLASAANLTNAGGINILPLQSLLTVLAAAQSLSSVRLAVCRLLFNLRAFLTRVCMRVCVSV
jgi:hypothetical protein